MCSSFSRPICLPIVLLFASILALFWSSRNVSCLTSPHETARPAQPRTTTLRPPPHQIPTSYTSPSPYPFPSPASPRYNEFLTKWSMGPTCGSQSITNTRRMIGHKTGMVGRPVGRAGLPKGDAHERTPGEPFAAPRGPSRLGACLPCLHECEMSTLPDRMLQRI